MRWPDLTPIPGCGPLIQTTWLQLRRLPKHTMAADNLTRGMVVTAVDRHPVANVQDFKRLMSQAQGKPALITFSFNGQTGFTVVQPSSK